MFLRSLDALKYTSGLGVACVIYIVTLVVLYGSQEFDACEGADGKCPGEFTYMMPGTYLAIMPVEAIVIYGVGTEIVNGAWK